MPAWLAHASIERRAGELREGHMRHEHDRIQKLVRDVLGPEYLALRVDRVQSEEDLVEPRISIRADLYNEHSGEHQAIAGQGVGIVDAFFQALVGQLAN